MRFEGRGVVVGVEGRKLMVEGSRCRVYTLRVGVEGSGLRVEGLGSRVGEVPLEGGREGPLPPSLHLSLHPSLPLSLPLSLYPWKGEGGIRPLEGGREERCGDRCYQGQYPNKRTSMDTPGTNKRTLQGQIRCEMDTPGTIRC